MTARTSRRRPGPAAVISPAWAAAITAANAGMDPPADAGTAPATGRPPPERARLGATEPRCGDRAAVVRVGQR